jgi:hypothetical protein
VYLDRDAGIHLVSVNATYGAAEELDFSSRDLTAPLYPVDPGPHATFCAPFETDKWEQMRNIAALYGFFD